jgi:hypothetical protein
MFPIQDVSTRFEKGTTFVVPIGAEDVSAL